MKTVRLPDPFTDDRGVIQDLIGKVDAVTRIHTVTGAVRGNHYHERTTQWTFVLSGALLMSNGLDKAIVMPGELVEHPPGDPHAWKAVRDTDCLVFTVGPRSGEGYESDVIRLETPLLT